MEAHSITVPIISLLPFLLMLLTIAIFPLFWNHFWEKNSNKLIVAIVLSIPIIIYLLFAGQEEKLIDTIVFDYVPFIILLGSLFTITGGIYLSGDIEAKPSINTLFLGIGAVLASLMGTTGAAMLLIRPVIRTNKERKFKVHTILFFIGIIANCGGLLTPLGDPPLFMMYLRGAPFEWFLTLIPEWFASNFLLLVLYYLFDSYYYKRERPEDIKIDRTSIRPIKIEGKTNFYWLLGVVLSVAFLNEQYFEFIKVNHYYKFIREAAIFSMAALSLLFTPKLTHVSNNFTWEPIKEVAYLFFGIFITMVPCLLYLEINAAKLGISSPQQFYYFTGLLSSFLDNTPTAVTFHSLALGLGIQSPGLVAGIPEELLKAISVAAVLFGSMTYIGNGPNFMVKAVAEENNIKMPSFFAYMYKFSLIILLPIFIIIQLLFMM
ncbi:MAG: sodium:proton antiporter [Melioribacteraceae bacterium]|nr:sodium:proton antiporter [Melioribacteraceae bacterium]